MDFFHGNLAGRGLAERILDGGRSQRRHIAVYQARELLARMVHRAEDLGTVLVHFGNQALVAFDLLIITQAWDLQVALGALSDIADVFIGNHAIGRVLVDDLGKNGEAIGNGADTDLHRGENMFYCSPNKFVNIKQHIE